MLELALRVKGKSRFEFWILRIPAYGGKPRADTRFGRQLDRHEIPDYRFGLGRILPILSRIGAKHWGRGVVNRCERDLLSVYKLGPFRD